ncbi:hypothetical protein ACG1BZ_09285 [Microbulbifer sp. CNSA002]|uniref:hypothetical protein n=1 Tax=unclassified Microbulbifer TaxID=2619833 RepID=UPI0039B64675
MKYFHILIGIFALLSQSAFGCSPIQNQLFKPNEDEYKWHTDQATGYVVRPPKLEVTSIKVARGLGSDGVSCIDAGSVTITVVIPETSPFKFSELGIYFKVVQVIDGENVLIGHQYPFKPLEETGKEGVFKMSWVDGAPKNQKIINMRVEVFSLTHHLEIGPSTEFLIESKPNG